MARSTNAKNRSVIADHEKVFVEVENTEEIFRSAYTSIRTPGNGTAANQGRLGAYTGAAGELAVGEALGMQEPAIGSSYASAPSETVTGNTSASEPPKAGVALGPRFYSKSTVTGVSAIGDQSKLVFLSDDDTPTLTPQARPDPVGWIIKRHADDTVDWWFFGPNARMAGASVERLLVSPRARAVDGGAGNVVTGYPMPFAGFVLGIVYEVNVAASGSPANVINAELNGTNVTGGTITITTAAQGSYIVPASFATANNYFSRGTLLDLESDAGTAGGSSPTGFFYIDVIRLPGT